MTGLGQLIELCLAIVFRDSPTGSDATLLLQFEQRRVERAVVQLQQIAARLLNAPCESVPMKRPHGFKRAQDHQSQSSLPDIGLFAHFSLLLPSNRKTIHTALWECNTKDSRLRFHRGSSSHRRSCCLLSSVW